ncbi:MAG TPA: lipoate--protein ligase family protein [Geobacterales bacterium]|nr:lipoate--protein ligase family protein [Geobacterales bacterium]
MQPIWRVIDTGPLPGLANMAIDEALLDCFAGDGSHPILRLYGWQPAALSLGRFQAAEAVLDRQRCVKAGVTVVRRITGGGVIFHADELTYSLVCTPDQIPPAPTVKGSFFVLTSFLLSFYHRLGLSAQFAEQCAPSGSHLGQRTDLCFAGRESADILVHGRKIGGNAQRRRKGVIFQHGSIPLIDRAATGGPFLAQPVDLAGVVTSLADEGVGSGRDELVALLCQAFADTLAAGVTVSSLTVAEEERAAELLAHKYETDAWNWRGEGG